MIDSDLLIKILTKVDIIKSISHEEISLFFKKWCLILNYKESNESFSYFLLDVCDDLHLDTTNSLLMSGIYSVIYLGKNVIFYGTIVACIKRSKYYELLKKDDDDDDWDWRSLY